MAFYQKYRPQKFSDIVGEDLVRDTLLQAVKMDKLSHAYLFSGPRGTGKTTMARLIAKASNCQTIDRDRKEKKEISGEPCGRCDFCLEISSGKAMDVIEIDAASNRGIDEIRDLRESVKFPPTKLFNKIYIIDEVHMLTREAFNALLKTLEEPPNRTIFILATTEPHKIPATIISRTQRFDFRRVGKRDIVDNLIKIAKEEKIDIDPDALDCIATLAEGGHRDAISLFEQVASGGEKIILADVERIIGITNQVEVFALLETIFSGNPEEGLKIVLKLYAGGYSLNQFNSSVIEAMRRILILKNSEEVLFEDTEESIGRLRKIANNSPELPTLIKIIKTFIEAGGLLREVSYPVLPLEMAIVESSNLINIEPDKVAPTAIISETKKAEEPSEKSVEKKPAEKSEKEKINVVEVIEKPDVANVPVVQMSDGVWDKVVEATRKEYNSLAALLRDAKPMTADKDKVVIGVKFKFHQDKISETKNIQILEKIIRDITGSDCKVECVITDFKKKPEKPSSDEDLLAAAEEVFD